MHSTALVFTRILGRYHISTISVERISGQLTCFNSSAKRSLRDTEHRQRGYTVQYTYTYLASVYYIVPTTYIATRWRIE